MTPVNPSGVPVWGGGFLVPQPTSDNRPPADQYKKAFEGLGRTLPFPARPKEKG
jgi:hypothetical protein